MSVLVQRWQRRAAWLLVLAVAGLVLLGTASPASAHASLVASDPAEGSVLATAPETIRLTFNETIAGVPDGVQVFDASGDAVEADAAVHGSDLEVGLAEEVGTGTLVVVWRVVSEDGHPVSGSLTFSIGAPSATVTAPPAPEDGPSGAPIELSVVRWIAYLGLFLAAGLTGFALLVLPAGAETDRARRRLVVGARVGVVAAGAGWLLALPLVAVYQLGGDLGSLGDGATWSALARTEYVVTGGVVAGLLAAVTLLGDGQPDRSRRLAALVAAGVASCAPALAGHTRAATPEALAVATDMLHLVAGSVWLGGLTALALVLPDLAARGTVGAQVLARFSGLAAGVLAALVVTGTFLAWRIAGSWDVLTGTGYGRLLLVKIAGAALAAAIAGFNRFRLLPAMVRTVRRRDRRAGARVVARATAAEAGVLVAVLLVTGLLVDRSPEPEAPAATAGEVRPQVRTTTLGEAEVTATVAPPTTGPSTVTIEMRDAAGESFEGFEAPQASLSSADVDLGPVPLESVAPGTYAAEVVFPAPGAWRLQVSLRVDEFANPVSSVEFTIG